jgi:phosphoserine phosphatase
VANDRLTGRIDGDIVDAQAKARAIRDLGAGHPGLTVVIGDGANDLPMFAEADVSVAYRAKPVVREKATHMVDFCGLDAVPNLFR